MIYRTIFASGLAAMMLSGAAMAQSTPSAPKATEGKGAPPGEAAGQPGGQGAPATAMTKKHHGAASKHKHKVM